MSQVMLFPSETITDYSGASFSDMRVVACGVAGIREFIEANHYSGNINGVISDYCFRLCYENEIIGGAIYGRMAMANQWKRFSYHEEDVIELRRLCCIDATPKNTESFFIARTLKWLAKNTKHKMVVSYADAEYGHDGTIYKASNFKYLGKGVGAKVIVMDGKRYHDKSVRTKHNGKLKPFAVELSNAIENGQAEYKETAGKHCYIYYLRTPRAKTGRGADMKTVLTRRKND